MAQASVGPDAAMNVLIEAIKAVLGHEPPPRFDPATDETVQYLREQRRAALLETRRLRKQRPSYFPMVDMVRESGNGHRRDD